MAKNIPDDRRKLVFKKYPEAVPALTCIQIQEVLTPHQSRTRLVNLLFRKTEPANIFLLTKKIL